MKIPAIAFALSLVTASVFATQLQDNKALAASAIKAIFVDFDQQTSRSLLTDSYIQHNPHLETGPDALVNLIPVLQEAGLKTRNIRMLAEGDLVVAHTLYENAQMIGAEQVVAFDVWRIENGRLAEHWDNLQPAVPAADTASGNSMIDGETEITDRHRTAENKALVQSFVDDVLRQGKLEKINRYLAPAYIQHNPRIANGPDALHTALQDIVEAGIELEYGKTHLTIAEGNFVFTATEGSFAGKPTAFYDLFRVADGRIIEHWDVVSDIPSKSANNNGIF